MAPALAAGNCVVLKPARLTPLSVLLLMEVIGDLLPPGVINVVNGAGGEIGEYLATSKRIAKVAFTGSTEVGQQIMQYATQNIIPVTLEPGREIAEHLLCRRDGGRGRLLRQSAGRVCPVRVQPG